MKKKKRNLRNIYKARKIEISRRLCAVTGMALAVLYLLSMGIMTWLVQKSCADDFSVEADNVRYQITENVKSGMAALQEMGMDGDEACVADCLYAAIGRGSAGRINPYHMISAGIYDSGGRLAAKSCSLLVMTIQDEDGKSYDKSFDLDEYMAEDDLETLAGYWTNPDAGCRVNFYPTSSGGDLRSITVMQQKESLTEPGENVAKTVWYWNNPNIQTEEGPADGMSQWGTTLLLPGAAWRQSEPGTALWERWRENQKEAPFPEKIRSGYQENGECAVYAEEQDLFEGNAYGMIWIPDMAKESGNAESGEDGMERTLSDLGRYYTLLVRSEPHPWLAAMDYLKYVYLASLTFIIICAAVLIIAMERTYRQRARMEEYRRDFTNAMAHEMKTPLSVIRGFAENLLDNPDTGKREYYLRQMIGQTEEMDGLVKEMIRISKLDSEKLTIRKEEVSVREILEDETSGLTVQTEEKGRTGEENEESGSMAERKPENIRVFREFDGDISLEGDRELLALALRNILANAVSFNRPGGEIRIRLTQEKCVIENTGEKISPEDLPHVCEIFYIGNKSRSGEKHFGLGLYLAERILQLHEMELQIENMEDGVRVTVQQKR